MGSIGELKESNIKNCTYYCFDGIVKIEDFGFNNMLIDKKNVKIFSFMTFHTKNGLAWNHCELDSRK